MLSSKHRMFFGESPGWEIGWVDFSAETVFPVSYRDANGHRLRGDNDYTLHFLSGQLPPARYWLLSLYDLEGFFCENAISRYSIGNLAGNLLLNADDSLTIYIQSTLPDSSQEINWLPAPPQKFLLVLHMWQPEEKMRYGAYSIPPVRKASRNLHRNLEKSL